MLRFALITLVSLTLAGCATLGYYGQAIGGHLSLQHRMRPIEELIADPTTAPELKAKLTRIAAMRDFATRALALPDNASYRHYADLERPFAVWNVFATPELSLTPKEWCFPFAGCVAYRGYFAHEDAERDAAQLRNTGHDVHIGGVVAYSTLGWFDDPLLNTMLRRPEPELAGLIFHELAHQQLYAKDDTAFNESFATTIEREGVRRWLATQGASQEYTGYLERQQRREEFFALVLRYRARLVTLYDSAQSEDLKRAGKQSLFDELRRDYAQLKQGWNGYNGFDGWFEELNNAKFISVGLYHEHLAAFEALLARHHGDLPAFYRTARELAQQSREQRDRALAALAIDAAATSAARGVGTR